MFKLSAWNFWKARQGKAADERIARERHVWGLKHAGGLCPHTGEMKVNQALGPVSEFISKLDAVLGYTVRKGVVAI